MFLVKESLVLFFTFVLAVTWLSVFSTSSSSWSVVCECGILWSYSLVLVCWGGYGSKMTSFSCTFYNVPSSKSNGNPIKIVSGENTCLYVDRTQDVVFEGEESGSVSTTL